MTNFAEYTRNYATVYTRKNCPQCKMTKKWLEDNGIAHKTVDIAHDTQAAEELKRLGYQAVPVVVVHGDPQTSWSGFRPDVLESEFGGSEG